MSRYASSEAKSDQVDLPKSAAIYVRISKDTEEIGAGVARQEQDCRTYAAEAGWTVAEVYKDNNLSAWQKDGKRPAFEQMLQDVRGHKRDGIIIYNLDRFTRRMDDAVAIVKLIEETSVPILDSETQWDLTKASQQSEFYGTANSNFKSSNDTSRRTIRGKKAQAYRGEPSLAQDVFGYKFIEKTSKTAPTYEVVPAQSKIIKDVYKRFLAGETKHSIAKTLNERGITTVNGKQWSTKSISDLLERPANAGIAVYKGELLRDVKVNWKPIIDAATYDATLAKMKKMADESYRRNNKTREPKYGLLTGVLRCAACGYNMHYATKKRKLVDGTEVLFNQYLCTRVGCQKVARQANPIEEAVNKIVEKLLSKVEVEPEASEDGDDYTAQLDRLKQRKAELQQAYASLELSMSDFMAMNPLVDRQISELEKKMAHNAAVVQKPELIDQWKKGNVGQKRAVIKLFIDYIAVKPSGHGKKFDFAQLEVVTRKAESASSQSPQN